MKKTMKKTMQYKWVLITGVYVMLIFLQSMLPAKVSSAESGYALDFLSRLLVSVGAQEHGITEFLIRKSGHFLEYFGFGLLLVVCVRQFVLSNRRRCSVMAAFLIWVPFLDETIQLFSEGRSSQITDVWLDMAGGFTGILLMTALTVVIEKKSEAKQEHIHEMRETKTDGAMSPELGENVGQDMSVTDEEASNEVQ